MGKDFCKISPKVLPEDALMTKPLVTKSARPKSKLKNIRWIKTRRMQMKTIQKRRAERSKEGGSAELMIDIPYYYVLFIFGTMGYVIYITCNYGPLVVHRANVHLEFFLLLLLLCCTWYYVVLGILLKNLQVLM
jgi:hypothetical protein